MPLSEHVAASRVSSGVVSTTESTTAESTTAESTTAGVSEDEQPTSTTSRKPRRFIARENYHASTRAEQLHHLVVHAHHEERRGPHPHKPALPRASRDLEAERDRHRADRGGEEHVG